jgi:hypothetical protein
MSEMTNENYGTPAGFSISTETIAKGAIRIKIKIWVDHLELDTGIKQSVDLYIKTLEEYRSKGFKIDGDQ